MSVNQSRADKSEQPQYRNYSRSGTSGLQRNFPGGSGKGGGGGTAPPPASSSVNPAFSSNRSYKKSSNEQGGQSRVTTGSLSSDSNNAATRVVQNGAHSQPPIQGTSDAPVTGVSAKPANISSQKSTRVVPKAPSSNASGFTSDTVALATPAKASGDPSRAFPLQFGSISPGFVNGMQIPARTSSAPPNLVEQKRDQARHDSSRAAPMLPTPTIPKQQVPTKDVGAVDQSKAVDVHPMSKAKRDVQVAGPPTTQAQKSLSVHPIPGIPMQIPFHQTQVQVQFGGPNPQMQSHGMTNTSLSMPRPMPMPMPLPMGNPSQVQQQVFVSGLQTHLMQPQEVVHQGQSMNFPSQMGTQLPPQLGNMGISMTPHFPQQQAGKFVAPRKTVKITHPDTHEELRLDKRAEIYGDGVSSGQRSHPGMLPQSQPFPSFAPAHPINYYPNSYNSSSLLYRAPNSLPLTSTQKTPSSQAPRFYNQVSQGPPTVSFMNPSPLNSFSVNKTVAPLHGIAESSTLEHARDLHNVISSPSSASVQVTVKPAASPLGEKGAESSLPMSVPRVEKGSPLPRLLGEASTIHPQTDSVTSKPSLAVSDSVSADNLTTSSSSSAFPVEDSTSVSSGTTEGTRREVVDRLDEHEDEHKRSGKKGHSLLQDQVGGQSTTDTFLPSQLLELGTSSTGIGETVEAIRPPVLSGKPGSLHEISKETLASTGIVALDASDSKTDSDGAGRESESTEVITGSETAVDSSQENEIPKHEAMRSNDKRETMFSEETKKDHSRIEIIPKTAALDFSESIVQTKENLVLELITSNETGSSRATQDKLEEPVVHHKEGEGTGTLVNSSYMAVDALLSETSSLNLGSLTISHSDRTSSSDTSLDRSESMGSTGPSIAVSVLDHKSSIVSIPSHAEAPSRSEIDGTEGNNTGLLSPSSGSKDKPLVEQNMPKGTLASGKKKRKEALQKADSLGSTSDLYMAYKGPVEMKETVAPAESTESISCSSSKQLSADTSQEEDLQSESKAEPDDWEDAADLSTPKLETSDDGWQTRVEVEHHCKDGNMAKKYTRDFLLKFMEQCTDLPEGFEIASDIAEVVIVSNGNVPRQSFPSPGKVFERPTGGPRQDRRGSGMGDDDKWSKVPGPLASGRDLRLDIGYGVNVTGLRSGQGGNYGVLRNPHAQSPVQYAGGIPSVPMQSMGQGAIQRNNSDSDRWQRATGFQRGLIPSPQTPLPVMHKAERKYEVGKITDEEQAKQRQLKGILNKLTPQNFEKLFEQVKQVNIDNAGTLSGVISQIFDKALMEPTFCEMYANFCHHLSDELPNFTKDNEKITFKRLLLNKCQEEFERGEREQEEANRAGEEGETKQSEEEREEKRIKARRRMLGNIRLIGELYKKKMLTERIMHQCINKLLGQYQNPDEEDVESLCKLMSTIGEMIDHSKAKVHMDSYFVTMANLSNNMKLSSRVRFMLKDAIDLRKNKWQQRRKVEGPKKIEEVHRDAAQERQAQANRLTRGPNMNSSYRRVQPMDFAPRGANILSSPNAQMGGFRGLPQQQRGYGTQDVRTDERHPFENRTLSVPLPQRPIGDDSITLGPQGGLARGMSIRGQPVMSNIPLADMHNPDSRRITGGNGFSSIPERPAYASREDLLPRYIPERFVSPIAHDPVNAQDRNISYASRDVRNSDRRSQPTSPPIRARETALVESVASEKEWPEEHLRDMSIEAIKEFYSAKDEKEVVMCVKDLNAPSFYPSMISIWVTDSFERKDMERDLLAKLLISLTKSRDPMLNHDQLVKGFESVLASLEDAVNDAPKAAEFLGRIFAKVILDNVISLAEIGKLIYEGGEEQGRLVEIGLAAEILGSVLEIIISEKGDPVLNEIRAGSSLHLENFVPPNSKKALRLDKFI